MNGPRFSSVLFALFLAPVFLVFGGETAITVGVDPPWILRGDGYLIVTKSSTATNLDDAAIPAELLDSYVNDINLMLLVDYRESPVGPYGELLYMPGNFRFMDGWRHFSITKIFVDSQQSLEDGRRNWGIPKELAHFSFQEDGLHSEIVTVGSAGQTFAQMRFTPFGPRFPVNTFWIAPVFRTLGQVLNDTTFVFSLSGEGRARLVHFEPIFFDGDHFPDMPARQVLAAFRIEDFTLVFPEPQTFEMP
ncbi:acetoacetate decarboxylase family protein [Acanthopleuribacter pedis]|uniref:Acetoacetate decarboxylase family protein n=1 Tax=Acanthopleuribacter pedis TaxID=442870 RepID=A0A8J7QF35_9BACT|nr:acetoacetate decarboxylase family protein [Acanthopleuribacter pedis]MBO1322864.1 acetoacetate decarboxylase family protein [Acanthopleuribacter pedis]